MTIRNSCALGIVCATILAGQQYTITTIAGNGSGGFSGDNGPAAAAQLSLPGAIAFDTKGNLYIADGDNNRVRMVSGGNITTIAGTGTSGYAGDGAAATSAQLNNPTGVAVDAAGNIYVADTGNQVIRKVAPGGTITTFAGDNGQGPGYGGDGGPATQAALNYPSAIALDPSGNLYIADLNNNSVRKVANGVINTIVGIGNTATRLKSPSGIAFDAVGNLYIADRGNGRIAKFTFANGSLTTVAGSGLTGFSGDGGQATAASLNNPSGVAVDALGNLYIADKFNSRIRKVAANGVITTIAGKAGAPAYTGDGGIGTAASLNFPNAVAVNAAGNVYVADTANNAVRLLQPASPVISDNGVVNAASYAQKISPGALATVFGSNFASANTGASAPLPAILGGVSVKVNGQAAPMLYVTSGQANFQVPWETGTGAATITVSVNGIASNPLTVPVTAAGPGLFVTADGRAIAQNSDYSLNGSSNPAPAGGTIVAYLTGSGPVSPAVPNGAATPATGLTSATSDVTATIGGTAAPVSFAGLAPNFVGLMQANIVVPAGLGAGDYPLVITIGGEASNPGTVSVTQ